MKGIAHFISGAAIATFFEEAVKAASEELSFIIVLGGIFGILPDTLDFKFARYFEKPDYEIDPHPKDPDPQGIADKIAQAINEAYERGRVEGGRGRVVVKLHTMKLGADLWRRYSVQFDTEKNEVVVKIGPVVTTSQVGGKAPYNEARRRPVEEVLRPVRYREERGGGKDRPGGHHLPGPLPR